MYELNPSSAQFRSRSQLHLDRSAFDVGVSVVYIRPNGAEEQLEP
jgi:hypothetical protein